MRRDIEKLMNNARDRGPSEFDVASVFDWDENDSSSCHLVPPLESPSDLP